MDKNTNHVQQNEESEENQHYHAPDEMLSPHPLIAQGGYRPTPMVQELWPAQAPQSLQHTPGYNPNSYFQGTPLYHAATTPIPAPSAPNFSAQSMVVPYRWRGSTPFSQFPSLRVGDVSGNQILTINPAVRLPTQYTLPPASYISQPMNQEVFPPGNQEYFSSNMQPGGLNQTNTCAPAPENSEITKEQYSTSRQNPSAVTATHSTTAQQPLNDTMALTSVEAIPEFTNMKPLKRHSMLSKSRKNQLEMFKEDLMETINLTDTSLLEQLQCLKTIGSEDKELIMGQSKNNEKVTELLKIITRKTNEDYENLCQTLEATNQGGVVKNYLLTKDDVVSARVKLAEYMLTEFTDVHLYTPDEGTNPVGHNKIYVNVNWKRYSNGLPTGKTEQLQSYLQIFSKMRKNEGVRVVITGEPGSGKTTFVKNVCHQWAGIVKGKDTVIENDAKSLLSRYLLVIPIILRLIQQNMTMPDIIHEQISGLKALDIHAIIDAMETRPQSVLVLFDGYDEMLTEEPVNSIIKKKQEAEIEVLVTTRPHEVIFIKSLGSQAMNQLAEICTFTEKQIDEYITLFYELHCETELGPKLFSYLKERNNLLEIARLPIRLEMMCLVWIDRQDLGEKLVDLYIKFVEYLLSHKEKKRKMKTPARNLLIKYANFLSLVGSLAFSWSENGMLKTVFSHAELAERFKDDLSEIKEFGCVTKYHPSVNLASSYWSFTHKSLQEYFVAYYLSESKSTKVFDKFVQMCNTISRVESQQLVLTFLCGLDPKSANTLLEKIIIRTENDEDCHRLFDLLFSIIPEYRRQNDIKLPLPRYVDFSRLKMQEFGAKTAFIERLFTTDKDYRHLQRVSTSGYRTQVRLLKPNAAYIKQLTLTASTMLNFKYMAADVFPYLLQAIYISIDISCGHKMSFEGGSMSDFDEEFEYDEEFGESINLACIYPMGVQFLNIEGKNVIKPVADVIENYSALKKLSVIENNESVKEESIIMLCTAAAKCKKLKVVHLEIETLCEPVLQMKSSVRLSLTIRTVTNRNFTRFVDLLEKSRNVPSFHELHLAESSLDADRMGNLLSLMPKLHVLHVNHGLTNADTIENMVSSLKNKIVRLSLRELYLVESLLTGSGHSIGKLLHFIPDLHTLDLGECKLVTKDIEDMQKEMPKFTRIRKLRLEINRATRIKNYNLWTAMPDLEKIALKCEPFQEKILHNTNLPKLHTLDLSGNKLSVECLRSVLKSVHPRILGLAKCDLSNMKEFLNAIANFAQYLEHLDIHGNQFKEDLLELKSRKNDFESLNLLNVGNGTEEYREIINGLREEMMQSNPDFRVYFDDNECLWLLK